MWKSGVWTRCVIQSLANDTGPSATEFSGLRHLSVMAKCLLYFVDDAVASTTFSKAISITCGLVGLLLIKSVHGFLLSAGLPPKNFYF